MNTLEILASLDESINLLQKILHEVEPHEISTEKMFMDEIGEGDKGRILWPLRVALTGKKASPGPFEIMDVLGKHESLLRIDLALAKLDV